MRQVTTTCPECRREPCERHEAHKRLLAVRDEIKRLKDAELEFLFAMMRGSLDCKPTTPGPATKRGGT